MAGAAALACGRAEPPQQAITETAAGRLLPAAAKDDVGEVCADVSETRACWLGVAATDVRRVARPLPGLFSVRGYRCSGLGKERRPGGDDRLGAIRG